MKNLNKIKKDFFSFLSKSKISLIVIFIFLVITYWSRIISNSITIDTDIYISNYVSSYQWWIELQRWGLVLLNKLLYMGPVVIPKANILTFIFIYLYSISFGFLFYLFSQKNQIKYIKYWFILPIIFFSSPIFAEQYNFILQNASVSFAMLILSISCIIFKYAFDQKNFLIMLSCLLINALCFATYQSFIPFFILLVVCMFTLLCINEDKKNYWKFLIVNIGIFIGSCLLFVVVSRILSDGNSYLQFGWKDNGLYSFHYILECIVNCLRCDTIFYNYGYLISLVMLLFLNIFFVIKKKFNLGLLLSDLGIALSPFFIMFITGVDQLKRTQFNYSFMIGFCFLLFILYFDIKKFENVLTIFVIIISLYLSYYQASITSSLFYSDDVKYNNDVIYANNIASSIKSNDNYDDSLNYKLILVGKHEAVASNNYIRGEVIGISFFEFDYQYYYGPSQRGNALLKSLGHHFEQPSVDEFEFAKKYALENNMKIFPNKDGVVFLNDIIIVRMSEEL